MARRDVSPSPGSVPSVERKARHGAHTRVIKVRLSGGTFFSLPLLRDDSEHEFATKTSTHVLQAKVKLAGERRREAGLNATSSPARRDAPASPSINCHSGSV